MRKPFIAGNWKLNKTVAEALELANGLKQQVADVRDVDIVVGPVFTALHPVAESLKGSNIAVAAQNCYLENTGAYTGEVSPLMLKDVGCRYVIIGHSERRQIFRESDDFINQKIKAALAEGLEAIFCIGETLEEREADKTWDVLKTQLRDGLKDLSQDDMKKIVIAYEPVWAIGTGKTATGDQAQEAHAYVRGQVRELLDQATADAVRILYGGSVKPDNVDGLMAKPDIDGTLVGGASLKADDFARIVKFQA